MAAAAPAPVVVGRDPAGDHRPVGLDPLPDGAQTEPVEAGESRQVRASEGSVEHVGVFRMGSVRTSIFRETSTHLPPPNASTRSAQGYTLKCEEPV